MYPLKPRKRLEMAHRPFSVWRIITRSKGVYIKLVAIRGPSASSSWKPVDQGSLLEAGLYLLLRSLVLVDLLERRLALKKLLEHSGTRAGRGRNVGCIQMICWNESMQTGLFLEDWQKGLALGQELWLWWRLRTYIANWPQLGSGA